MDLLEHFGNVDVKDWGIYNHIGIKKKMKYKEGFVALSTTSLYKMFDLSGNLMLDIKPSNTSHVIANYDLCPSKGLVAIASRPSTGVQNVIIEVFDVKTALVVSSFSEYALGRSLELKFLENGNIATLNQYDGKIRIYDKDGNKLKESAVLVDADKSYGYLFYNKKRNVFYAYNGATTTFKIIDANTLQVLGTISKDANISHIQEITEDGNIVLINDNIVKLLKINYNNYTLSDNISITVGTSTGTIYFAGVSSDRIHLSYIASSTATSSIYYELDINDLTILRQQTLSTRVLSADKKYLYARNYPSPFSVKVMRKSDFSEVITVPAAQGSFVSGLQRQVAHNKGLYATFKKYW